MKRLGIYTFLFLLLAACGTKKDETQSDAQDAKAFTLDMAKVLPDTVLFKPPEVVFLETNESAFQRAINRIFIDDDKIITFDRIESKIVLFDRKGKYLSTLHNIGRGPQEYRAVLDVGIDTASNQLFLLSDFPFKIMVFDYDMQYVKEYKLSKHYRDIVVSADYFYCRQAETHNYIPNDFHLDILDRKDGSVVERFLPISSDINKKMHSSVMGNNITQTGSALLSTAEDNSIYELKGREIRKKYDILQSGTDTIRGIVNMFESENYLIMGSGRGLLVADKTSDTLRCYQYGLHNLAQFRGSLRQFLPVGGHDDKIVFFQQPAMLKQAVSSFEKAVSDGVLKADEVNKELLNFVSKVDESDNPILFIYELKEEF